jgi:Trypsin-like peptidase domain
MGTEIDAGSLVTSRLQLFYRNSELGVGTGFFYEFNGQLYLITNWHIVSGRNFQTLKCIAAKGGLPDRLKFTVGCRGHIGEWMEIDCMLYEDAVANEQPGKPTWLEHAVHGHNIDVVAIPITLPEDAEVLTVGYVNTLPTMSLKVSREVFVLGYPKGISGGGLFPIWKKASIATEPAIQLDCLPKILVDTATRKGMSGAPVVAIADGTFCLRR